MKKSQILEFVNKKRELVKRDREILKNTGREHYNLKDFEETLTHIRNMLYNLD